MIIRALFLLGLLILVSLVVVSSAPPTVLFTVNVSAPLITTSPELLGVFFEEINHAGHGGIYQQQIDNSNFETNLNTYLPWTASGGGQLALDQSLPINYKQPNAMRLDISSGASVPIIVSNPGHWGFRAEIGVKYNVSMYVRSSSPAVTSSLTVGIASGDGSKTYGSAAITGITTRWQKLSVIVTCSETDYSAVFNIIISPPSSSVSLFFDVITVMPLVSYKGLSLLRPDLTRLIDELHPTIMRFPGGNYLEGQYLKNRFNWKNSVGIFENRTGHYNDHWNYYTEDGLGIYEFLEWIETLTDPAGNPTRVIWVVHNGVSMSESVSPDQLGPYITDALDSVDFAIGDSSVPGSWAAIRAQMGHPAPFRLDWIAIGNEDCGHPNYEANYQLFYQAFIINYPQLKLIANCLFTNTSIPLQYYDYHVYPTPLQFIHAQYQFDTYTRNSSISSSVPYIFNSEYASHGGNAGNGTLLAAIGEAVWMTGLQRNSDIVRIASYAPLLENMNSPHWRPNMIRFVQGRAFGTPSYWNQWMYARAQIGIDPATHQTLSYTLVSETGTNVTVSVAPSIGLNQTNHAQMLILKLINYGDQPVVVDVKVNGVDPATEWRGHTWTMSNENPMMENSLDDPTAVAPYMNDFTLETRTAIKMNAYSIVIVKVAQMKASETSKSSVSSSR